MTDLPESVMLWLPSHLVQDEEAVNNVTKANGLIFDFCDRDITLEEVLDEISSMDINPDIFANSLDFQLRLRGV